MKPITARKQNCQNSLSLCLIHNSAVTVDVRLDDIDKAAITEAVYQIGDNASAQKTLTGGSIVVGDNGLEINLTAADTKLAGKYRHYLELTDASGTYKVYLSRGRVEFQ